MFKCLFKIHVIFKMYVFKVYISLRFTRQIFFIFFYKYFNIPMSLRGIFVIMYINLINMLKQFGFYLYLIRLARFNLFLLDILLDLINVTLFSRKKS